MVQNPDQKDFAVNTENTRLMSASGRIDLNVDQDKNDKTGIVDKFEDGNFPSLRPNYDRRAHAHPNRTGNNTQNQFQFQNTLLL